MKAIYYVLKVESKASKKCTQNTICYFRTLWKMESKDTLNVFLQSFQKP